MNFKENSNFGWKTKSGGVNTEFALWGYKNRDIDQFHVFLSKSWSSLRVLS